MSRKVFDEGDISLMRKYYSTIDGRVLAIMLRTDVYSIYHLAQRLNLSKGKIPWNKNKKIRFFANKGSFKKGIIPWDKGTKGVCKPNSGSFKTGHNPVNTLYDGAITKRYDRDVKRWYYWYRVSEGKWIMYHVKLWIDKNGPVPDGHIVVFKNGNSLQVRIENLKLITLEENMKRNSIHNYPEDLKLTIIALGQLKRRINEKNKS